MDFKLNSLNTSFSYEENIKEDQIQNIDDNEAQNNKTKLKEKEQNETFKLINRLIDYNTAKSRENKNSKKDEEDSLFLNDKINYYDVEKKNVINYMTPIKVNNIKYDNKNKFKKNKKDEKKEGIKDNDTELSNIFSISSPDEKNVMVSELDIELLNTNSNFYTDYKKNGNNNNLGQVNTNIKSNNINMIKKREIDFKKEIEQNLKKFLKNNQEKNKTDIKNKEQNKDINNNNKEKIIKMNLNDRIKTKNKLFKKLNNNFNYCLTELINKNSKNNNTKKDSNNSNKLSSFTGIINKLNYDQPFSNYYFKKKVEYNKNNINQKNLKEIIKINIPRKINNINNNRKISSNNKKKRINFNYNKNQKTMNFTNICQLKSKIFYLQNKNKNINNKNNNVIYSHRTNTKKNTINNLRLNKIISEPEVYFNDTEIVKTIEKPTKSEYNSLTNNEFFQKKLKEKINWNMKNNNIHSSNNINNKNIIIQNFNCFDYNNINININNNIIKPNNSQKKGNNINQKKLSKKKINSSLNNIKNINNFKTSTIYHNNTIENKNKFKKIKYLCDSSSKNCQKNVTSLNNSKFIIDKKSIFQRKHNEKNLTYKENPDIKNKILIYYLNKKDLNNINKYKKKVKYIKINDNEQKKNFHSGIIANNNNVHINKESFSSNKKEIICTISKQKTYKKIENGSFSNNIFNNGKKKFVRKRKEKRNTQVCSNSIKKNLLKFKFNNFK